MAERLYQGMSHGMGYLIDGYVDYAEDVIANRSIPSLQDGLKPVQRRILHTFLHNKSYQKSFVKSAKVVGDVMGNLHPHGDSAIYDAMVRMSDRNGSFGVPLIEGKGNLGTVESSSSPAASRYTEVKLGRFGYDFDGYGASAIERVPTELEDGNTEPVALAVRYPYALMVGSTGLGVGASTTIPSFNFWDVIGLMEKVLDRKDLGPNDIIYPDFNVGGNFIQDQTEAYRLMMSGKGTMRFRAEVDIAGREIKVKELPVNITIESALRKIDRLINEKAVHGLKSAYRSSGRNSDYIITIECSNKSITESVLLDLYRHRILQNSMTANMLLIDDGKPYMGGVYDIVRRWIDWRRGLLTKAVAADLEVIEADIKRLWFFIDLVQDDEAKAEYLRLLTRVSRTEADKFLEDLYDDITGDIISWIGNRSASAFLNGDSYATRYNNLLKERDELRLDLDDIDRVIRRDIADIRVSHKGAHERRTRITTTDYSFTRVSSDDSDSAVDDSPAWYTIMKNGFIKKTSSPITTGSKKSILAVVEGKANSALIGFDDDGRILKVYGEDLMWTAPNTPGTYVFKYVGDSSNDKRKLLWMGALDGTTRMLVFVDGKVSFLQTSKWVNAKARYRIVNNGVAPEVKDMLLDVLDEADTPEVLFAMDSLKEDRFRFGVMPLASVRRGSSAKSRIKVFGGSGGVQLLYVGSMPADRLHDWVVGDDSDKFIGRVRPLLGNPENPNDAMAEGIDFTELLNEPTYVTFPGHLEN